MRGTGGIRIPVTRATSECTRPLYDGPRAPGRFRTDDPWIKSPLLYLLSYRSESRSRSGIRTRTTEGLGLVPPTNWAIRPRVRLAGIEPATCCSGNSCAIRCATDAWSREGRAATACGFPSQRASERIRTSDLLIRSQALYPLMLRRHIVRAQTWN